MADVRAFAGLRYNPARIALLPDAETVAITGQADATRAVAAAAVADSDAAPANTIAHLVAPPYDVISPDERAALVAQSAYNVVRLELPDAPDGGDRYTEAARLLHEWIAAAVLARDPHPAYYVYDEEFIAPDDPPDSPRRTRRAIYAAVRLYDWHDNVVMPHEGTMTGPKADRLALLSATHANLSPIFAIYDDPDNSLHAIFDAAVAQSHTQGKRTVDEQDQPHRQWTVGRPMPGYEFEDAQGNRNRLTPISDPAHVTLIAQAFADKKLYIADGHHRYETALTYRDQQRAKTGVSHDNLPPRDAAQPYDFVLMALSAQQDPGLVILPTHRLITDLTAEKRATLDAAIALHFVVETQPLKDTPVATISRAMAERAHTRHIFGAYGLRPGVLSLLHLKDDAAMAATGHDRAWQRLDVAILQTLILEEGLGMTEATLAAGDGIVYVKEIAAAVAAVDGGAAQIALFLLPTRITDLLAVADAHERMPRKSTYFYPKLPTGVVIRSLD